MRDRPEGWGTGKGTTAFGESLAAGEFSSLMYRENKLVQCPMCDELKTDVSKTCHVCSMILRGRREYVYAKMIVLPIAEQIRRFRVRMDRRRIEQAKLVEWFMARMEEKLGVDAPTSPVV